jgi:phosphoenolpyruvate-protein phosphotransferase (PTS system enzyme I)
MTDLSMHSAARRELRLQAQPMSRGAGIGTAVFLAGARYKSPRASFKSEDVEKEIDRLRDAIQRGVAGLDHVSKKVGVEHSEIFRAHALILTDDVLRRKIEDFIKSERANAEWAVESVMDQFLSLYDGVDDQHMRDRRIDLADVTERLLAALADASTPGDIPRDSVIISRELTASTLAELDVSRVAAVVTEDGGWTSHAFILAREMGIPAVTGLSNVHRLIKSGEKVIVNGYSGQVTVRPSDETITVWDRRPLANGGNAHSDNGLAGKPKTLDNREITLRANLDILGDYLFAKAAGAEGIGLYRSELLFNSNRGYPSEEEQVAVYLAAAGSAGSDPVSIRTFDLSSQQVSLKPQSNPALGMRALRLGFAHEADFRVQVRSLLRASTRGNVDIILPMVSDTGEVAAAKTIIDDEKRKLDHAKIARGNPRIGAMVETPSAVMMIDEIAAEVDFINVGTNDLVQYMLAVDRDNSLVSGWFRTLHPAVLRAISLIIRAAENAGIPAVICGEMAGSPTYSPVLIGLGAVELSMNVNSLARVRPIISSIAFSEASEIARRLVEAKTADESEEILRSRFREIWAHLFSDDILPEKKTNNH